MPGDMTSLLSPSSRLATDVIFLVQSVSIPAHKAILATALPAFDDMFFGDKANRLLETVDCGH